MTLGKLIDIADEAYSYAGVHGLIRAYFDNPSADFGDTLAKCIAIEIKDTYDPELKDSDQLEVAMRAMISARRHLEDVIKAFAAHL